MTIVKEEELLGEIIDALLPSHENDASDANPETCTKSQDVVKKKPLKSKIDDPKHVSKVYCYEKITIKDLKNIKPIIEAMTERVGKVWRCKFYGKTTPGSQRNTLGLHVHIESHFEGVSPTTTSAVTVTSLVRIREHSEATCTDIMGRSRIQICSQWPTLVSTHVNMSEFALGWK